jgi:hypothetical protein
MSGSRREPELVPREDTGAETEVTGRLLLVGAFLMEDFAFRLETVSPSGSGDVKWALQALTVVLSDLW